MTDDLIAQVKAMEADADQIVSESLGRAEEMRASVPAKVAELREEQRRKDQQEIDAVRQKLDAEARQEMQKVDEHAEAIAGRLDAVDQAAVSSAVDLILKQLSED